MDRDAIDAEQRDQIRDVERERADVVLLDRGAALRRYRRMTGEGRTMGLIRSLHAATRRMADFLLVVFFAELLLALVWIVAVVLA